jgi:hypothetical protein
VCVRVCLRITVIVCVRTCSHLQRACCQRRRARLRLDAWSIATIRAVSGEYETDVMCGFFCACVLILC